METYITVAFWMGIFSIAVDLLALMALTYPRTIVKTVSTEVAGLLITTGFCVWSGFLLFG